MSAGLLLGIPGDWRHRARCKDADPDLFFAPDRRGEPAPVKAFREGQALALCALCPVRAQCLDWALDTGQGYGIWGGLGEEQLRLLRRERARSA